EGRGRIVCTQPRLAAGARTTSSFLVQAPLTRATINLTAVLTSSTEEVDRTSNTATLAVSVDDSPGLAVTAQFPGPAEPGGTIIYDTYVQNFKRVPVSDITLTIPLRTGWAFVSANGEGWQCTSDAAAVTCRRASLEGQALATFQLMLRAPPDPAGQPPVASFIKVTTTTPLLYAPTTALPTQAHRIHPD